MATAEQHRNVELDDIIIAGRLAPRQPSEARRNSEISALHELARGLVNTPKAIMDRLVELSLDLCDGQSGGISLFEEAPDGDGVFRWYALKGRFAPYTGATTLRHFSPCGVVLDRRAAIIVKSPERYYPYLVVEGAPILEGMLAPLTNAEGTAIGTLWVITHDPDRHFTQDDRDSLVRLAAFGSVGLAVNGAAIQKDKLLAEKEELLLRQQLMLREVNHRVANSLQLAGAMLRLQGRRTAGDEARQELNEAADRIASIGLIHSRLYKTGNMSAIAIGEYLQSLAADLTAAYRGQASPRPLMVNVATPEALALPPDIVTKLGLIVNELVTNSFKHAAGSSHCNIRIAEEADTLELTVSDDGPGLPAGFEPTGKRGLGTLVVLSLVNQMKGRLTTTPSGRGAHFSIIFPKTAPELC